MNIHLRRLVQFLLIGAFLLACVAGWYVQSGSSTNKAHAARAKDPIVTITINPAVLMQSINSDFLGLAAETSATCDIINLFQTKPEFAQLFKNLGSATLRIGGGTVDGTLWNLSSSSINQCTRSSTVVDPTLLNDIFGFAKSVGWKITWQVPLKPFINSSTPPKADVQEAQAVISAAAPNSLLSIEFGNEPEYYHTSIQNYLAHWNMLQSALMAQGLNPPLSGPATGKPPTACNLSSTTTWLSCFVNAEASKVSFASMHYFNQRCGNTLPTKPNPTITDLLIPATMTKAAMIFNQAVGVAKAHGLPLAVNATNSYCHGGQPGVSNEFASALWAVDYAFTAAEKGVRYLNFLGVPNDPLINSGRYVYNYAPINKDGTPAPEYYGLLLYHLATMGGGSIVIPTITPSPSSSLNVTAHSVVGPDGHLHLVIINKGTQAATVNINTTIPFSRANVMSLNGTLGTNTGITLGGASIGSNGTLNPTASPVSVSGANSSITVPAGSAVVITYM